MPPCFHANWPSEALLAAEVIALSGFGIANGGRRLICRYFPTRSAPKPPDDPHLKLLGAYFNKEDRFDAATISMGLKREAPTEPGLERHHGFAFGGKHYLEK